MPVIILGPTGTRTAVDDATIGTRPWVNITGVFNPGDNNMASGVLTITGGGGNQFGNDYSVLLWVSGTFAGVNQAVPSTISTIGGGFLQYTGMWGLPALDYRHINSPEFGVAWAAYGSGTNQGNQITHYLVAKNFGLWIPTGSIVVGVDAHVYAQRNNAPIGSPIMMVISIEYIEMTVYYTHDKYFQGVQTVTGFQTVTF